jgi:hypothetical protein
MYKESIVHIQHGILFSHKNECHPVIFNTMDGTEDYYVKFEKASHRRQMPYAITQIESEKFTSYKSRIER